MRYGLSNITLQEKCSVLTYDNSQIGLTKLISLLFLSICNCFICWLSFTSNEHFLIVGSIKHWKSQCGENANTNLSLLLRKHSTKVSQNCIVSKELAFLKFHLFYGNFVMAFECGRHLIPSTKLTSSSHKTFHFSYMKFLDEMFIKVKVSSIFKEKSNSG